jgi:radical SAM protein with 4Fe4S-binding SPASM domain
LKTKLNDILRFLSVISVLKLINSIKLRLSYLLSILFNKSIILGKPESISIEPINLCNLHCLECPTGTDSLKRKKGAIDYNLYKQIIDDGKKYLYSIILYFQGEPFLSNDIFKQINYAKKKKIYTITSTNGHFLDKGTCNKIVDSRLDRLLISLDGTNQKTYEKYRVGGDFNKVILGIKTLINAKEKKKSFHPKVILQFLVFKHNQDQITEIKQLAKQLKVDKLEIKTAQIINNVELNTEVEKYSRYKISDESLKLKSKLPNYCKRMWNSVVITVDGNISPCCFDKDSNYKYGNYSDLRFKEIRNSKQYKQFSNNILQNRKSIDICRNCNEGLNL